MAHFKIAEFTNYLHLEFLAPEAGNAFGLAVARELAGIQKKYKKWEQPVVVTSAHPTLFCSGGNLSDYKKLKGKAPGLNVNREITKHLSAFAAWPIVKLALVEGDVLGGGLEWLACFDYRWTAPHALFCFWQRRKILGEEKTRGLLRESEMISAPAALRLGLVDRVISGWKIRESVIEWSRRMDDTSVQELHKWSASREAALFQKLWMGPEHKTALARWR
jgi:enoyl-CoA hydratase/carnithine racemase